MAADYPVRSSVDTDFAGMEELEMLDNYWDELGSFEEEPDTVVHNMAADSVGIWVNVQVVIFG